MDAERSTFVTKCTANPLLKRAENRRNWPVWLQRPYESGNYACLSSLSIRSMKTHCPLCPGHGSAEFCHTWV